MKNLFCRKTVGGGDGWQIAILNKIVRIEIIEKMTYDKNKNLKDMACVQQLQSSLGRKSSYV